MNRDISRIVAALVGLTTVSVLATALPATAQVEAAPDVRITEWMYNPVHSAGEYIEITNLGATAVSLAGWSFDDDSRAPGTVPLDGLGTLAAGESAIIA
ncbi:MAG TPA: lamin tail domain-containing protein, partial [Cellulomonas sp.]|nr:lamin tail domain-containing protein [Cellulomonas sp.]